MSVRLTKTRCPLTDPGHLVDADAVIYDELALEYLARMPQLVAVR